jgi:hypothetical protein
MAEVGFVMCCFRAVFRLHTRKPATRCAAWEWSSEGTAQGHREKRAYEAKTGAALRNRGHEADNTTHTMRDTWSYQFSVFSWGRRGLSAFRLNAPTERMAPRRRRRDGCLGRVARAPRHRMSGCAREALRGLVGVEWSAGGGCAVSSGAQGSARGLVDHPSIPPCRFRWKIMRGLRRFTIGDLRFRIEGDCADRMNRRDRIFATEALRLGDAKESGFRTALAGPGATRAEASLPIHVQGSDWMTAMPMHGLSASQRL